MARSMWDAARTSRASSAVVASFVWYPTRSNRRRCNWATPESSSTIRIVQASSFSTAGPSALVGLARHLHDLKEKAQSLDGLNEGLVRDRLRDVDGASVLVAPLDFPRVVS